MAKTLKHVLLKQQKNIDEEIFHHLSRIKVLNDTPKELLGLSPAEIFAKTQLYKKNMQFPVSTIYPNK